MFCDVAAGGAIDADGFTDPQTGKQYVVYKVDGNSNGHGGCAANTADPIVPTPLILQEVSATDGFTLIGTGTQIMTNLPEDGPNVEAPALAYDASTETYILFFNSGCFTSTTYNVQYATSKSIFGTYTRGSSPLLVTGSTAANVYIPGSLDVTPDGKKAIFHGDLNMGWFNNDGSRRVRGLYTVDISALAPVAQLGALQ